MSFQLNSLERSDTGKAIAKTFVILISEDDALTFVDFISIFISFWIFISYGQPTRPPARRQIPSAQKRRVEQLTWKSTMEPGMKLFMTLLLIGCFSSMVYPGKCLVINSKLILRLCDSSHHARDLITIALVRAYMKVKIWLVVWVVLDCHSYNITVKQSAQCLSWSIFLWNFLTFPLLGLIRLCV